MIPAFFRVVEKQGVNYNTTGVKRLHPVAVAGDDKTALEQASFSVTNFAVTKFFHSLRRMQSIKPAVCQTGNVQVKVGNNVSHYKTSSTKCTCSFFHQLLMPCVHILLLRKSLNLDLFAMFDERYHLPTTLACNGEGVGDRTVEEADSDGESDRSLFDWETADFSPKRTFGLLLSPRAKYVKAMETCRVICDLMSNYGMKSYQHYIGRLRSILRDLRQGKIADGETEPDEVEDDIETEAVNVDEEKEQEVELEHDTINFSQRMKRPKGRPKLSSKQVQFNRKGSVFTRHFYQR